MESEKLKKRYLAFRAIGVALADMDASAVAGYYLLTYPGDPLVALDIDMNTFTVPISTGKPAKVIITTVLGSKRVPS